MLRLILRSAFVCILAVPIFVLFYAGRIAVSQNLVRETFCVPLGRDVLFVGNSRVGCGICESEAFHNKVIWNTGQPFFFAYYRIMELERLGQLSSVKAIVVNLDKDGVCVFSYPDRIVKEVAHQLPFMWRYVPDLPVSLVEKGSVFCGKMPSSWWIQGAPPHDSALCYSELSEEQKEDRIKSKLNDWMRKRPVRDDTNAYMLDMAKKMQLICNCHKILFLVMVSPVADMRIDIWDGYPEDDFQALLKDIERNGIAVRDFRQSCPQQWFRDEAHLTPEGGRRFTAMLYKEVFPSLLRRVE